MSRTTPCTDPARATLTPDPPQEPPMADDRIPVRFAPPRPGGPPPGTALVVEATALAPRHALVVRLASAPPGHAAGCPCCAPRPALVAALHGLFLRRARGAVPWFDRVEVRSPRADPAALDHPLLAGRFRLETAP